MEKLSTERGQEEEEVHNDFILHHAVSVKGKRSQLLQSQVLFCRVITFSSDHSLAFILTIVND